MSKKLTMQERNAKYKEIYEKTTLKEVIFVNKDGSKYIMTPKEYVEVIHEWMRRNIFANVDFLEMTAQELEVKI